jgi:hypothetical protein
MARREVEVMTKKLVVMVCCLIACLLCTGAVHQAYDSLVIRQGLVDPQQVGEFTRTTSLRYGSSTGNMTVLTCLEALIDTSETFGFGEQDPNIYRFFEHQPVLPSLPLNSCFRLTINFTNTLVTDAPGTVWYSLWANGSDLIELTQLTPETGQTETQVQFIITVLDVGPPYIIQADAIGKCTGRFYPVGSYVSQISDVSAGGVATASSRTSEMEDGEGFVSFSVGVAGDTSVYYNQWILERLR